jgi:hypothetical protein
MESQVLEQSINLVEDESYEECEWCFQFDEDVP